MTRRTFVFCQRAGRIVPQGMEWRPHRSDNQGPSLLAAPMVWGVMPETKHIIDAKVYDSREKYAAVTRAHGATEIGRSEMKKLQARGNKPVQEGPTVKESLKRALQMDGHL